VGELVGELVGETECHGRLMDAQTRCVHWHSPLDIIAIRFKCCGKFYACASCHAECEEHAPARWPVAEFDAHAILCGACGRTLSIREYFACESVCPHCSAAFNPRCGLHRGLYFEEPEPPVV